MSMYEYVHASSSSVAWNVIKEEQGGPAKSTDASIAGVAFVVLRIM